MRSGPRACGKTSLLLALAIAAAKGEPFLDRTTPGERLRTLVIATDSGVGPLKKSLDDLGVDPDDPLFKPGHSDQMIWIWGAAADQGHQSWCADINGVVELRKFVQQNNIAWTLIDSAKSVSSAAGWSYSDNDAVRELLRYMRERASASRLTTAFVCCRTMALATALTLVQKAGLKILLWSSAWIALLIMMAVKLA